MSLLVRVEGYEPDKSQWSEVTTTQNASAGGVAFKLDRPLYVGQVLRLTMHLPFRRDDQPGARAEGSASVDPSYAVFGVVRDSHRENGGWRAGVMFFGEQPPRGFNDNPAARFLFPWDVEHGRTPAEQSEPARNAVDLDWQPRRRDRRQHDRHDICVDFWLQQVDEWEGVLGEGHTVTENISRGGARLVTGLPVTKGDVLLLRELGGRFSARAEVTHLQLDEKGVRRLHVRFLGSDRPDHLVPDAPSDEEA